MRSFRTPEKALSQKDREEDRRNRGGAGAGGGAVVVRQPPPKRGERLPTTTTTPRGPRAPPHSLDGHPHSKYFPTHGSVFPRGRSRDFNRIPFSPKSDWTVSLHFSLSFFFSFVVLDPDKLLRRGIGVAGQRKRASEQASKRAKKKAVAKTPAARGPESGFSSKNHHHQGPTPFAAGADKPREPARPGWAGCCCSGLVPPRPLSKTGRSQEELSTVLWRFPGDRREAILGLRADLSTTKRCWRGTLLRFGQRGFGLLEHLLLPPRSAPVAAPDRLAPYPSTLTTAPSYSPGPRDLLDAAYSAPGGRVSGGCLSAMPFSGLLASAGELLHTP